MTPIQGQLGVANARTGRKACHMATGHRDGIRMPGGF